MKKVMLTVALLGLPTVAMAQATPSPATYVMKAGAGDQYEIQSSKLVLATTKNPAMKQFANMMVADHTKSTAEVKAAAMQSNLKPKPPMLDAMGSRNIAALKATTGSARDTLYVKQQKAAHQTALELHQGYAQTGTAPALKQTAAKIAPVVQHHIQTLSSM
ncbi:DUF4142 domain-containing protein [Sphingomonas sp. Leaf28]|uniref:DUF4142 domain-containing protein n=1 Tax=Sphingomonas sp. Leaf28 TaxID=1735695 RepID=UPI0006FA7287|nr:DUF4142 domain-containing protein [Sphingomonas sp. Leaf28]KQN12350.1 hypothetical protein ASE79_08160 [Sphingomonas sp. Leaf28]